MIDFQDARLGCAQYDLASLLRDSYYQLEEEVVYELVDYYIRSKEKLEGVKENRKEFMRVFDLMSIQRNFKAIGSFASFYMKRQDVRYLKFIGNTFENIRRNLLKFPEMDELRCLLFRYYYF
jgi:aminoglycoside/choline kinase family phosphotransferase